MAGYGPGKFVLAPILIALALSALLVAWGIHLRRTGKLTTRPAQLAWSVGSVLPVFVAGVALVAAG